MIIEGPMIHHRLFYHVSIARARQFRHHCIFNFTLLRGNGTRLSKLLFKMSNNLVHANARYHFLGHLAPKVGVTDFFFLDDVAFSARRMVDRCHGARVSSSLAKVNSVFPFFRSKRCPDHRLIISHFENL